MLIQTSEFIIEDEEKMDTKLNGNEIIGIIFIIISAILLLTGNFIEELWPMTDKFF